MTLPDLDQLVDLLASPDPVEAPLRLAEIWRASAALASAREELGANVMPDLDGLAAARFLRANASPTATLSSRAELRFVRRCAEQVLDEGIPGDWLEAGVWRGGRALLLRAILAARGDGARRVVLADTFSGFPAPDPRTDPDDALVWRLLSGIGGFSVPVAEVRALFSEHGLLDHQTIFLEGPVRQTLATGLTAPLSLVILDISSRAATEDALSALAPRLSPGAIIVADDFQPGLGSARAVERHLAERGLLGDIQREGAQMAWWRTPL